MYKVYMLGEGGSIYSVRATGTSIKEVVGKLGEDCRFVVAVVREGYQERMK